jgi:FKBP-type peptidyl-prolyl cis-trans isomerase 2
VAKLSIYIRDIINKIMRKPIIKINKRSLTIVLVVIAVIGCVLVYYYTHKQKQPIIKVENGDLIKIDYVARFENGSLFDTTLYKVAEEEGMALEPISRYHPLEFEVGAGKIIKGIDEAILGMQINQEKTILVPPEKGYANVKYYIHFDREQAIPAIETLSKAEFEARTGLKEYRLAKILPHYLGGWRVMITEVTNKNITTAVFFGTRAGKTWEIFPGWNATILEVKREEVVIKHDPQEGLTFKGSPSDFPFLSPYEYKIEKISNNTIDISYNPFESVADKSLEITFNVVEITKAPKEIF